MKDRIIKALRPALWTALFTFLALFIGTLTGWLSDVSDAIAAGNGEGFVLPDPSVLAKGAMSVAAAAFTGLVNFIIRYLQSVAGVGKVPTYRDA